jgi:hypothetical protein
MPKGVSSHLNLGRDKHIDIGTFQGVNIFSCPSLELRFSISSARCRESA